MPNEASLSPRTTYPHLYNGVLFFADEQDLEDLVHMAQFMDLDSLVLALGVSSMRNSFSWSAADPWNRLVDLEELAALINNDGLIGIGNDIFKINGSDSSVYMITDTSKIDSLKNAATPSQLPANSRIFSFSDDVFGILNMERNPLDETERSGCGEKCSKVDKEKSDTKRYCQGKHGPSFKIDFHVKYRSIGVYKWLKLEFHHKCYNNCSGIPDGTDFDIYYRASWKKRCKESGSDYRAFTTCIPVPCWVSHGQKYTKTFYNGTRCLTRYSLEGQAKFVNACDTYTTETTNLIKVEDL